PPGYVVDFDHPQRKGDETGYIVFIIGAIIALLMLSMRLYVKFGMGRKFAVEDVCMILSWIFGLACQGLLLHMWINRIMGVHAWEIPADRYNLYNLLIMCASVLYAACLGSAKFSLLLFYRRLGDPITWFRWAIHIVMFIVVGYTLGIIFSLIFPCHPVESNWDVNVIGNCGNKTAIYIATAALNIITDITILTLPIPVVAALQMSSLQRVGVICIFAVGSMTCVTSIIRLVVILPMFTDLDQTWAVSIPCVWIVVEANLVVICGCLPVAQRFIRHVAGRHLSNS
ncbi:uncharacterized protein K452DRAFT_196463, partial [Aplosporella prunicola CBS 121167]